MAHKTARDLFSPSKLTNSPADESLKPDRAAKLKDLLSRLGEVSVKLLRVKARPGTLSNADEKKARGLRTSEIGNAVPEKALKGRSISNKAT